LKAKLETQGKELIEAHQPDSSLCELAHQEIAQVDLQQSQTSRANAVARYRPVVGHSHAQRNEDVQSAPAQADMTQCLTPGTRVRTRMNGVIEEVDVAALSVGDLILSGFGVEATVMVCTRLAEQERDMIRLGFRAHGGVEMQSLAVTANHALPVMRPRHRRYEALPVGEVHVGNRIRTHAGEAVVEEVEHFVQSTSVIEIELDDARSTMYVSAHAGEPFVEVYGELTPPRRDDRVTLLHFSRYEQFREALLGCAELRACRMHLERQGFFSDLNHHDLGAGKMFVQPHLADGVLAVLRERGPLRAGDVVVSRSFEAMVLEAVRRREGVRAAYVLNGERLDLGHTAHLWHTRDDLELYLIEHPFRGEAALVVNRTFLHLQPMHVADDATVVTI